MLFHCSLFISWKIQSSLKLVAGIKFSLRYTDTSVCDLLGNTSFGLFSGLKEQPRNAKHLTFSLSIVQKLVSHLRQGCLGAHEANRVVTITIVQIVHGRISLEFKRQINSNTHTDRPPQSTQGSQLLPVVLPLT